jgi:hypothetical protein
VASSELSLDYAGRRFWLKSGYDEGVDGAPGLILKWRAVEQAAAAGLSGYELGGEAEDWKRQWASGARPRVNVIALGDLGLSRAVGVLLRPRMRRPAYRRVLPGFEQ